MRAPLLSLVLALALAAVATAPAACASRHDRPESKGAANPAGGEERQRGGSIKPLSLDGYGPLEKAANKELVEQQILDVHATPAVTADTYDQEPIEVQAGTATASAGDEQPDEYVEALIPDKVEDEPAAEVEKEKSDESDGSAVANKKAKESDYYLDESASSKKEKSDVATSSKKTKKKEKTEDSDDDSGEDAASVDKKEKDKSASSKKEKEDKSDDSDEDAYVNKKEKKERSASTKKQKKDKSDDYSDNTSPKKEKEKRSDDYSDNTSPKKEKEEKSDDYLDNTSPKKEKEEKSDDSDEATSPKKQKKEKKSGDDSDNTSRKREKEEKSDDSDDATSLEKQKKKEKSGDYFDMEQKEKSAADGVYVSPKEEEEKSDEGAKPVDVSTATGQYVSSSTSSPADAYASPKQQITSRQPNELPPAAAKGSATSDPYELPALAGRPKMSMGSLSGMIKRPLAKMLSPVIKRVCAKTEYPADCEASIGGLRDRGAAATDSAGVLRLAMEAVRQKAAEATSAAADRMDAPGTDPATRDALGSCTSSYGDIRASLDTADDALRRGDVDAAHTNLDSVETDVTTCDDGFQERGTPSVMADHDQELQKLASNLLSIGAAIHH